MMVSIRAVGVVLVVILAAFFASGMMIDELGDKAVIFLLVGLLFFVLGLGFWGSWKEKQTKQPQRRAPKGSKLVLGAGTDPDVARYASIPHVPLRVVVGVVLIIPLVFAILHLTTDGKISLQLLPFYFTGLMILIVVFAIVKGLKQRQAEMRRGVQTAGSLRAEMRQRQARLQVVSGPKVYRPSAPSWKLAGGLSVLGLCLLGAERYWFAIGRSGDKDAGIVGLCLILMALWDLGERRWVFLYDDRLEIRGVFSKGLEDRAGIVLCKPQVVYYREVKGFRHVRGLGERRLLQISRVSHPWQRTRVSIPVSAVDSYANLETDILDRIPAATPVLLYWRTQV
jgi:hypothetical protein